MVTATCCIAFTIRAVMIAVRTRTPTARTEMFVIRTSLPCVLSVSIHVLGSKKNPRRRRVRLSLRKWSADALLFSFPLIYTDTCVCTRPVTSYTRINLTTTCR